MVILLNGTSSSGKSSIVDSLNKKLDNLYFVFGVDKFLEPSMPHRLNMDLQEHIRIIDKSISGFNRTLGILANHIDYMIVDHVIHKPNWLEEVAQSLQEKEVFFVGVTAPLTVIEAREAAREDRQPGTARAQYDQIIRCEYDLIVDTSILSPSLAAHEIIKNLKPGQALQKYL